MMAQSVICLAWRARAIFGWSAEKCYASGTVEHGSHASPYSDLALSLAASG
jgi:hypothetical protein